MAHHQKGTRFLASFLSIFLLLPVAFSQTTNIVKTYTSIYPTEVKFGAGVTIVNVSLWGGGGGGSAGGMKEYVNAVDYKLHSGSGGGGSNWAGGTTTVTPNQTYMVYVGTGGVGGGFDGSNNPQSGGNGATSSFNGFVSYGGYGGVVSGFNAFGGARADNSVPDPGAPYAAAGENERGTQGGNGGLSNNSPYGPSGPNYLGLSGLGYPQVPGISTGGPGTRPGDGGGGGSYTELPFPLTGVLAERKAGGRGANGSVTFYVSYPTYRLTGPAEATRLCGSGSALITLKSNALQTGVYKVTYNTTNPVTTGNIATLNVNVNSATAAFTTIPLTGSSLITVTDISSGDICTNPVTDYNTVTVIVENTTANTWNSQVDFGGVGRSGGVAFTIGNKAYVGTGKNGNTLLKDFWQFDPATNTWTQLADFGGTARADAVGFAINNKGYIGTGNDGAAKNDFWEYDPFTNVWRTRAAFTGTARYAAAGFAVKNAGYIATGYNGSTYFNDTWQYNPQSDAWVAKAAFAGGPRTLATGFSILAKGYLGLGSNGTTLYKDFWEFDPDANSWTSKTDFGGVARSGAVGFAISNKGYVGTGFNGSAGLTDFYEYDPQYNTWTQKAAFTGAARTRAVGFGIANKGYLGTGLSGSTYYNSMYEFSPVNASIVTGNLSGTSFCTNTSINVPFTLGCVTPGAGTVYTALLSDENGNFPGVAILGSTTNPGGVISAYLPTFLSPGLHYRIKVIGHNNTNYTPTINGTISPTEFAVKPFVNSYIATSISKTSICRGDTISLMASTTIPNSSDTSVILSENFNSGATSWLITSTSSYPFGTNEIYNDGQLGFHSNDNSPFYITSSSGAASTATTNTVLQSPVFSTVGMNSGTLSFYHAFYYSGYNNGDSIRVQISTNQGQSWTTIYLNNTNSVGDAQDSTGFKKQTISLDNYMNQPNVVLRFNYGAYGGLGKWMIDNIVVKGISKINNFQWTSNPAGFTSSLQNPTGIVPVVGRTVYTLNYSNNYGCGSGTVINTQAVTVKDTSSSITRISICPTELPYTWNGLTFTTGGTQTKKLVNAAGCDSLAKMILTIKDTSISTTRLSICPSELPYTWNGLTFTNPGSQTAHFLNSVGCDSAATLNLTLKPTSSYTTTFRICQTLLPFTWNGLLFTAAGSQVKHYTNYLGCDSAVTYVLIVTPANVTAATNLSSVCPGANVNLTASSTGSGSSMTALNEKFNSTHNNWTTINTSSGGLVDSAAWTLRPNGYELIYGLAGFASNDNSQFYLTSAFSQGQNVSTKTILQSPVFSTAALSAASLTFYHHFSHQTNFANDSIRVLISTDGMNWTPLYVNKTTSVGTTTTFQLQTISLAGYLNRTNVQLRFEYNGSPIAGYPNYYWAIDNVNVTGTLFTNAYYWSSVPSGFTSDLQNPATFNPTQTATYTVTANNGLCAATASVAVVVNVTNPTSTTNLSICPSSLPYTWNGLTFTAAGTQSKHITTAGGCDSIATLNLTVKAASSSVTNITICPSGLPFTWNGLTFTAAGSQTKHLTNSVGCDSAATLNLAVQTSSTSSNTTITICDNQLPYTWNGLVFTAAGSKTKLLTNSFGCDSAATLNLLVSARPTNVMANTSVTAVCAGNAINLTASSATPNSVILDENFNAATNSWTNINASTGTTTSVAAVAWKLRPDGYLFGGIVALHSNDNSQMYVSDTYNQTAATNVSLQSPVFSTMGYSTASLTFYQVYMDKDANDVATVQVSTDNGTTWASLLTQTTGSGGYSAFVQKTVSLNAYVNKPTVMIRFNYVAVNDYLWAIDNVKITGTLAAPTYAWTSIPAGFTSTLQNPTGVIPTQSATYKVMVTNASGCSDSNMVVIVVKNASVSSNTASVCASALPYTWNGLTFSAAGTQTAHLTNAVGCDSAATLTLTVKAVSVSSNTMAVCQSALPYSWNGLTFNAAGTQTAHLLNSVGCDSAATLTVTISPSPTNLVVNASSPSFCAGGSVNLTAAAASGITATVLDENFNAPTNNWIKTNTTTGPAASAATAAWQLQPYTSGATIQSNDQSQYYLSLGINVDYGYILHTRLQSPTFSTVGLTNATLSFYHNYNHNTNSWDSIRVQVSTDGVTWRNVYFNNATSVGSNANNTYILAPETISLNSYLNQPNLRIRFDYNADWYGNWWAIDNVKVTGSVTNTYSWTSTPAGFISTLQNPVGITPTQTTTYTVAATNAGGCVATGNVTVTVKQPTTSVLNKIVCTDELPYTWNGATFTTAGTQTVHLTNVAGCDSAATLNLTIDYAKKWVGGSGNWSVPSNWCGGLPASGDSIVIASGNPLLDMDFTAAGTLTMSGSATLTIKPLKTLIITGVVDFGGKSVTLKSDVTGTGSIGTITGTLNNATNVTIERYIPNYGYSSWNLLSAPTYGNGQTIRQAWQEGDLNLTPLGNNLAGYGTLIYNTGTQAAAQAAGFDDAGTSSSLLKYNGTSFQGVNSTNTPIATKDGYFLFVRGDRSIGALSALNTATTLRSNGTLYQGYQTSPTIPANSIGLVGNLYPSAINFTALGRAGGVSDLFYLWDPKKNIGNSGGVYQTFSATNGYESLLPGGSYNTAGPNTIIPSGQAFWVAATGSNGTLIFPEDSKVSGNAPATYTPTSLVKIESRLYSVSGTNASVVDANAVIFDGAYSSGVDGDDATKIANTGENFGILQSTKTLTIEGRQPINMKDTIFFNMWNMQPKTYRLDVAPRNMLSQGVNAVLEDNFLNTAIPISLGDTTRIDFIVNSIPASYASNRFRIVFAKSVILPVKFISISAVRQSPNVEVKWAIGIEMNMRQYTIERSTDGTHFVPVGSVAATGVSAYKFTDMSAPASTLFYRVKGIGTAGDVTYSTIASVSAPYAQPAYVIMPNPVEGTDVHIMFKSRPAGKYTVRLLSHSGQQVMQTTLQHTGNTAMQSLRLPNGVARGAYQLSITGPDNRTESFTIMINN